MELHKNMKKIVKENYIVGATGDPALTYQVDTYRYLFLPFSSPPPPPPPPRFSPAAWADGGLGCGKLSLLCPPSTVLRPRARLPRRPSYTTREIALTFGDGYPGVFIVGMYVHPQDNLWILGNASTCTVVVLYCTVRMYS